jgi:hypothetical protein
MTAIWRNDGTGWRLLAPTGFPDEAALHDLVEETPQILPLAGAPRLVVVGREVLLGNGYADLLAVESSGRLVVVEIKQMDRLQRAQCEEKRQFVALLANLCRYIPTVRLPGAGRSWLPLSDMVFASVHKVYAGFSYRRFTTDLRDAFVDGQVNSMSHFNSVNRYMANPELTVQSHFDANFDTNAGL